MKNIFYIKNKMQYKIPVQIENEDPIFMGLSLRQLTIIMIWGWIAYSIFKNLARQIWPDLAAIPSIIIAALAFLIAVFKQYEMTFIPFVLAILRFNINAKQRVWEKGVDSFSPIKVWYVNSNSNKKEEKIDFEDKMERIKNLEENINKI